MKSSPWSSAAKRKRHLFLMYTKWVWMQMDLGVDHMVLWLPRGLRDAATPSDQHRMTPMANMKGGLNSRN